MAPDTAKIPCPRCGHGKKGGHGGRECIAMVPERGNPLDNALEWDWCACKYDQRKVEAQDD